MDIVEFKPAEATAVNAHAASHAKAARRGDMNIEDQLRSALALLEGLEVLEPDSERTAAWRAELTGVLSDFAERALQTEQAIRTAVDRDEAPGPRAEQLLVGLLLAFASRPPSRERLNVFTTNYDRLIEFGCDLGGIRVVDRFVGAVEPVFRSSRLDVDLHYNPPGSAASRATWRGCYGCASCTARSTGASTAADCDGAGRVRRPRPRPQGGGPGAADDLPERCEGS